MPYDEKYGQNPIGSGRYISEAVGQGTAGDFEANPDYYGDEVKMKKVTVLLWMKTRRLQQWQDRWMCPYRRFLCGSGY